MNCWARLQAGFANNTQTLQNTHYNWLSNLLIKMLRVVCMLGFLLSVMGSRGKLLLNSQEGDQHSTGSPLAQEKSRFIERWGQEYGYGGRIDQLYEREIAPRLPGDAHYLDHTAAALYMDSVVEAAAKEYQSAVYGNPHSLTPPSMRTTEEMEAVRDELLAFFGADPEQYELIFTRSATAGLHMVGELLPWGPGSAFLYTRSNHNSVLGLREYACAAGGRVGAVEEEDVEEWLDEAEGKGAPATDRQGEGHSGTEHHGTQPPRVPPSGRPHHHAGHTHRPAGWSLSGRQQREAREEGKGEMSEGKGSFIHEEEGSMVDEEAGQGGMEKGEGGLKKDESGVEQGEVRGHKEEGGEEDKGDNKGEEMCGGDLRCEGPLVADLVTGAMHAGRMARCDDQPGSASYPEAGVDAGGGGSSTVYSLFAYPAYDNFAGVLYNLSWVERVHRLSGPTPSGRQHRWLVLLDTAAFVPHHTLNLTAVQADFAVVSFYKIFGLPTGAGALIMRKSLAPALRLRYWAGGSVFTATAGMRWQVRHGLPASLEAGTPPFLEILALRHGLAVMRDLGGPQAVHNHTSAIAEYAYWGLRQLRHPNGAPLVRVDGKWGLHSAPALRRAVQGPTLNLQLLQPDGRTYSYRTAGLNASDQGLYLRWGCTCNPGACYAFAGVTDAEVAAHAAAAMSTDPHDEAWEAEWEWIEVKRQVAPHDGGPPVVHKLQLPLGSLRVSFGAMSRFEDAYAFVSWVRDSYTGRWENDTAVDPWASAATAATAASAAATAEGATAPAKGAAATARVAVAGDGLVADSKVDAEVRAWRAKVAAADPAMRTIRGQPSSTRRSRHLAYAS